MYWQNLEKIKPVLYLNIPLAKLAATAIYKLQEAGLESSFNHIAVSLYRMFPEKFKLVSFPEYPDFIRIDNTLRLDCNHARLVSGNRTKSFTLTPHGKMIAEETLQLLLGGTNKSTERGDVDSTRERKRNRQTSLINGVTKSFAYQKFVEGERNHISKFDTVNFLHGTLDTDTKLLKQNLQTLLGYAKDLNEFEQHRKVANSVLQFLKYIEKNWGTLIA